VADEGGTPAVELVGIVRLEEDQGAPVWDHTAPAAADGQSPVGLDTVAAVVEDKAWADQAEGVGVVVDQPTFLGVDLDEGRDVGSPAHLVEAGGTPDQVMGQRQVEGRTVGRELDGSMRDLGREVVVERNRVGRVRLANVD
jgi:hypothetical protein